MEATVEDLVPTFEFSDVSDDGVDVESDVDLTEVPPTPETPHRPSNAELVNSLLENTPYGNRLYLTPSGERVPARTRIIHEQTRVAVLPMRKEVPWVKGKQQASSGEVKAFKPDVLKNCCKRQCATLFPVETPQLKKARIPLFDSALDRSSMRTALLMNADLYLRHPHDDKPVCSTTKALLYSCSRSMLFPPTDRYNGRTTGDSNRARAKTVLSVCSWFAERMKFADVMPDTGFIQFSEPTKGFVKKQYDLDVETVKACPCELSKSEPCECKGATPIYLKCSDPYFRQIWFEHFPNVKTRKWCRFSKCTLCIQMRALRDTQRQNKYALLFNLIKHIHIHIYNRRILKHTRPHPHTNTPTYKGVWLSSRMNG